MASVAGEAPARVSCLQRSSDFERVLRQRSRAVTIHFALHHLDGLPTRRVPPTPAAQRPGAVELSTDRALRPPGAVDGFGLTGAPESAGVDVAAWLRPPADEAVESETVDIASALQAPTDRIWLGTVVPKRHARRAVTRSLLKRQIRSAVRGHAAAMQPGLWVVRLRAPFDRAAFTSAASTPLRDAARAELDRLLLRSAVMPSVRG